MDQATEDLLEHLTTSRAELRAAVDRVPVDARGRRPAPDRWSAAEVLEHLAIVERRIAGLLADALEDARANPVDAPAASGPAVDPDHAARIADRARRFKTSAASEPTGTLDATAAWKALEETRGTTVGLVRASEGLPLPTPIAPHPFFGPLTFRQWVTFVGSHDVRHARQIDEMMADGSLGAP